MEKFIAWVEIPTADFERAVKFYNSVLKTELQAINCGREKMACFPSGDGAIINSPGYNPCKDGTIVSLNVGNDLEGAMERVMANNGTIVQAKTKIDVEGRGYFAIFMDCEGNRVGLYGNE